MPTYKYRCNHCGYEFSQFQRSITDIIPSHECCEKPDINRIIVGTNFALKGKGWYKDNYDKATGSTEK